MKMILKIDSIEEARNKLRDLIHAELIRSGMVETMHENLEVDVEFQFNINLLTGPGGWGKSSVLCNKIEIQNLNQLCMSAETAYRFCKDQGQSCKIPAIKALREAFSNAGFFIGLGDAKLFVENFIEPKIS